MLDDTRAPTPGWPGDDRSPPRGLPPDAPLAMPAQVLERRHAGPLGWLRLLVFRTA